MHERDLLAGGDLTTQIAASTSAHRVPSTVFADYGRERKKYCCRKYLVLKISISAFIMNYVYYTSQN